eukprot:CAMPEP_0184679812 /NCGR_PEP_ID=MMETSP0312-20130426/2683_1 /TAXON_ID=31354 /ORGANISM="Compsopogon coeruleus, Strain SAG 36.94" /LENGTH=433 /DNA_ID=CAMNT_0027129519 /DNA_START=229 /DNA_END=1530 /DNA_ORIENTATION=-
MPRPMMEPQMGDMQTVYPISGSQARIEMVASGSSKRKRRSRPREEGGGVGVPRLRVEHYTPVLTQLQLDAVGEKVMGPTAGIAAAALAPKQPLREQRGSDQEFALVSKSKFGMKPVHPVGLSAPAPTRKRGELRRTRRKEMTSVAEDIPQLHSSLLDPNSWILKNFTPDRRNFFPLPDILKLFDEMESREILESWTDPHTRKNSFVGIDARSMEQQAFEDLLKATFVLSSVNLRINPGSSEVVFNAGHDDSSMPEGRKVFRCTGKRNFIDLSPPSSPSSAAARGVCACFLVLWITGGTISTAFGYTCHGDGCQITSEGSGSNEHEGPVSHKVDAEPELVSSRGKRGVMNDWRTQEGGQNFHDNILLEVHCLRAIEISLESLKQHARNLSLLAIASGALGLEGVADMTIEEIEKVLKGRMKLVNHSGISGDMIP